MAHLWLRGFRVGSSKSGGWNYPASVICTSRGWWWIPGKTLVGISSQNADKEPSHLSSISPQCGWISRTRSLRKRAWWETHLVWSSIRSHAVSPLSYYIHQDSHKGPHNLKGKKYRLFHLGWGGPVEWASFCAQKHCRYLLMLSNKLYMFCFNYFVVITYL